MPDLTDAGIRLQVLLERVKAGENRKIDAFLKEIDKSLRERLTRATLTAVQRDRVEDLVAEVGKLLAPLYDAYTDAQLVHLHELAGDLTSIETRSLAAALDGFDVASPVAKTVRAAVLTSPLGVRGPGGGMLLTPFIQKWAETDIERIQGVIRRGYFEGRTTDQVVRDIRGTKAANYADGILAVNRRNARTVAHTALQHVAHAARAETWKANADIVSEYRWVSTLDSRTSEQCQSLDGQVFPIDEGPMPPIHPNCRSTVVPVTKTFRELGIDIDEIGPGTRAATGGPVAGDVTYFEWLKTQSEAFQIEALGPERTQLFRDGGISVDEFARLQLGKNFEPLTLAEMRDLSPLVFERAGL